MDPFFKHTVACMIAAVNFKTNYATVISDTPNSCSKTFYWNLTNNGSLSEFKIKTIRIKCRIFIFVHQAINFIFTFPLEPSSTTTSEMKSHPKRIDKICKVQWNKLKLMVMNARSKWICININIFSAPPNVHFRRSVQPYLHFCCYKLLRSGIFLRKILLW